MKDILLQVALGLAIAQWLVFVLVSTVSREESPASGFRRCERNLLISTGALAIVWIVAFGFTPSPPQTEQSAERAASSSGSPKHGACTSVDVGMGSNEVTQRLGPPDETRNDEAIRGPGAAILVYRDSRCAVHLLDERVEFID